MIKLLLALSFTLLCSISSLACGDRKISEFTTLNSIEDSAPALNSALDALIACKGGTLTIDGPITLRSGVDKNFLNLAHQIVIKGNGSNSQIHIAVGGITDALTVHNLNGIIIEKLTFIGGGVQGAGTEDARNVLRFHQTKGKVRDNLFVGLGTVTPDAAVIKVTAGSDISVEDNNFLACRSNSGLPSRNGTIVGDSYGGLRVTGNTFKDYTPSLVNGLYYSTSGQAGMGWIVLVNPHNAEVFSTPLVVIDKNEFDEGSQWAVIATSSGPELQSLRLANNKINAGIGGGYWLHRIKYLEIDGGLVGLHTGPPQVPAIQLLSVKYATIRNFQIAANTTANKLVVDNGTIMLRVIDSKFGLIVNNAQAWRIEDGGGVSSSSAIKYPFIKR